MHKKSTGNVLFYFCLFVSGLATFPELKRNVNAAISSRETLLSGGS